MCAWTRRISSPTVAWRSGWDRTRPAAWHPSSCGWSRQQLDAAGHEHVRIVASGGFNAERIRAFETAGVPVDAYGVGSALIRGKNDFTADIVLYEGRPCSKVGREYRPNDRLELVR